MLRALEYGDEKRSKTKAIALDRREIIGDSPATRTCIDYLAQASRSDVSVLITGETGTGKELFARALHVNSCAAISPLLSWTVPPCPRLSWKASFSDMRKGPLREQIRVPAELSTAHGGTLFLDEVGELPKSLQKAFLRVLQEHRFRPVGGRTEETSDFRLIAATNRDLDGMVASGSFRNDLLFRIRSCSIQLPPLRERGQDIRQLSLHYMARACGKAQLGMKGFSPDFFDFLETYTGPAMFVNSSLLSTALLLPPTMTRFCTLFICPWKSGQRPLDRPLHTKRLRGRARNVRQSKRLPEANHSRRTTIFTILLEDGEKKYFGEIVARAGGSVAEACRISGLSRSRLYYFLQKYGLSFDKHSPSAPKNS